MNPYSGHLVSIGNDEDMARRLADGYLKVPQLLQAEAEAAMGGNTEAHVNLRARSPLSDWAKKKRKAKIAANSRRINRR